MKQFSIEDIRIPCLTLDQKVNLIDAAEQTALRFCAPIYLVGSAIFNQYPNDIDIYIAVSGPTYMRLFTNYNRLTESKEDHLKNINDMKLQQARLYRKQKTYFESKVKSWDFDVKFQNIDQFLLHKGNRIRLDFVYQDLW